MPDRMTKKEQVLHALLSAEGRKMCRDDLEKRCSHKRIAARVDELQNDGWVVVNEGNCPCCGMALYHLPHTEKTLPPRTKTVGVEVVVDNRVGLSARVTRDVRDNYSTVQVDSLEVRIRATVLDWMRDNGVTMPDLGEPLELMHSEDAIDIDALLDGEPEPAQPEAKPEPRPPEDEDLDAFIASL